MVSGISILQNFPDGGYAMSVYFDYKVPPSKRSPAIEIKKGCVSIHDANGKVKECITKTEFENRYGMPKMCG